MKIIETETVVRHLVEFDEAETIWLKKLGQIPSYAESCARLRLTDAEIREAERMLADGENMLKQLLDKVRSRS